MARHAAPTVTERDGEPIGTYLRDKRIGVGVSVTGLARQANMSHAAISFIEAGKRHPRPESLRKILVALAEIEAAKSVAA